MVDSKQSFVTLAAIELNSIAIGVLALDSMLKRSDIHTLLAEASCPGKYLILFTGEIEDVLQALEEAIETADHAIIDDLILPQAHQYLLQQLCATHPLPVLDEMGNSQLAIGLLETWTAPALLGAIDCALKTGECNLVELHLLAGIGGKSTATIAGDVESVSVALEAGAAVAAERDQLCQQVIIPRPDPGLAKFVNPKRPRLSR